MTRRSIARLGTDGLDDVMLGDWDRVVETVGDRMQPMDYYPERYRVEHFPSEEQLAAMAGMDRT